MKRFRYEWRSAYNQNAHTFEISTLYKLICSELIVLIFNLFVCLSAIPAFYFSSMLERLPRS